MSQHKMTLRALEPEDLELLYQIENDRELWDVGPTNVPYSHYALRNYIANSTSDIYADRQVRLMVEVENVGTIGIVDLVNYEPQHNRAEVGIVIQKPFREQGYATEVLCKVVEHARRVLHIHQLYAYVANDNEASLNLFRHAGFTIAAQLDDWLFDGSQYHPAVLMQLFL